MSERGEELLQRSADAASRGDTRGAIMLLFHAAGAFDAAAASHPDADMGEGARAARRLQ